MDSPGTRLWNDREDIRRYPWLCHCWILLAMYLNILTVGNVKSAGRAVRSAVRQQLLVLKVCVFQSCIIFI
jgi:hypothetical protein